MELGKSKRVTPKQEPIPFDQEDLDDDDDNQFVRQTSCLFCPTVVSLRNVETTQSNRKRGELIKNICGLLRLTGIQIPDHCPEALVPLCWAHENELKGLWDLQKSVVERVNEFEKRVAHFRFFGANVGPSTAFESLKFIKLREMIAAGYRSKLQAKTQSQQATPPSSQSWNHQSSVTFSAAAADNENCETEVVEDGDDDDSEVGLPNAVSPQSRTHSVQNGGLNLNGNGLNIAEPEGRDNGSSSVSNNVNAAPLILSSHPPPNPIVGKKPDFRKTRRRTYIKQEVVVSDSETSDEEDNVAQASSSAVPSTRRHFLLEGVEVFRRKNGKGYEHLRCGMCRHDVYIPKAFTSGDLPSFLKRKMRAHILAAHKKRSSKRAVNVAEREKRQSSKVVKSVDKGLGKGAHHQQQLQLTYPLECDICGRILNGNFHRHKFSHKNAAEQIAAIKAGEPGAWFYKRSGPVIKARKPVGRPTSRRPKLQCNVCFGFYSGKGALSLHMRVHQRRASIIKARQPRPRFQCKVCLEFCTGHGPFAMHMKTHQRQK